MKRLLYPIFLLVFSTGTLSAQMALPQNAKAMTYASTISAADLQAQLTRIASTEFEGRETGTVGQQKAAEYLAGQFQQFGLPAIGENGGYLQSISFIAQSWEDIDLKVNGEETRHLWDFYAYPRTNVSQQGTFTEALFLGFGIDDKAYSDYHKADVQGKLLLIYDGEPMDAAGKSRLTGTITPSSWSTDWRQKLQVARAKGAAGVIIIDRNFKINVQDARKEILNSRMDIGKSENPQDNYVNNWFISSELARKILGNQVDAVIAARNAASQKGKLRPVKLKCQIELTQKKRERSLQGSNVLGFIEGSDPQLKEEVVIVSAHYDHLGKRGDDVYFGANDNGSGTSTVLEIAQAFAQAKAAGEGPRRSVLCLLVSGEEKGLLGSQFYASNPIFPLANTVVDVNVDMVGRIDDKHVDNPNYIYVIGADRLSSELHSINENINATYTQLELDYTYNDEKDPNRYYYRSDHYNFARKGIPAIFFFNGTHKDYHRTSDTVDKINFPLMERTGRLIFHTTWELANRDQRIVVDKPIAEE